MLSPSIVVVRLDFDEVEFCNQIKQAGGRWSGKHKVWFAKYDDLLAIGLVSRIVPMLAAECDDVDFVGMGIYA